jgi:hemoglobin-like flavoprotein
MDARRTALVQQSFERATALGDELAALFCAELFAIDPTLRTMFDGDMRRQHMKFMMTLALVVRSLHASGQIHQIVGTLAVKHAGYGLRPEHYTPFGNALLRTLKKVLGAAYTPDVRNAWVEAFCMLAAMMKAAADERQVSQTSRCMVRAR